MGFAELSSVPAGLDSSFTEWCCLAEDGAVPAVLIVHPISFTHDFACVEAYIWGCLWPRSLEHLRMNR